MSNWKSLPDHTRVWIYQSSRVFALEEQEDIKAAGNQFIEGWNAHGKSLKAAFDIFHDRFIVLFVDEAQAAATGCSIDSSVALIKSIEERYKVDLFDRMTVAWKENGEIKTTKLPAFEQLVKEGKVNESTIVYNNLVPTKGEFEKKWESPVSESWHSRLL